MFKCPHSLVTEIWYMAASLVSLGHKVAPALILNNLPQRLVWDAESDTVGPTVRKLASQFRGHNCPYYVQAYFEQQYRRGTSSEKRSIVDDRDEKSWKRKLSSWHEPQPWHRNHFVILLPANDKERQGYVLYHILLFDIHTQSVWRCATAPFMFCALSH